MGPRLLSFVMGSLSEFDCENFEMGPLEPDGANDPFVLPRSSPQMWQKSSGRFNYCPGRTNFLANAAGGARTSANHAALLHIICLPQGAQDQPMKPHPSGTKPCGSTARVAVSSPSQMAMAVSGWSGKDAAK